MKTVCQNSGNVTFYFLVLLTLKDLLFFIKVCRFSHIYHSEVNSIVNIKANAV